MSGQSPEFPDQGFPRQTVPSAARFHLISTNSPVVREFRAAASTACSDTLTSVCTGCGIGSGTRPIRRSAINPDRQGSTGLSATAAVSGRNSVIIPAGPVLCKMNHVVRLFTWHGAGRRLDVQRPVLFVDLQRPLTGLASLSIFRLPPPVSGRNRWTHPGVGLPVCGQASNQAFSPGTGLVMAVGLAAPNLPAAPDKTILLQWKKRC